MNEIRNNQSGIAHVATILIVLVITVIGLVGWKVWGNMNKETGIDTSQSQNESQQTTVNDSTLSSKQYLKISQWGVSFEIPTEIPDLMVSDYLEHPAEGSNIATSTATLDSPSLEASGAIKATGTQERHEKLGYISRQKTNSEKYPGTTYEKYAKTNKLAAVTVGDYFYYYNTISASDNSSVYTNKIKTSILDSLKSN